MIRLLEDGTNKKRQRFVEQFLVDLNATAAAKRAGYSKKTARQQGARLLTNVDIAKEIKEAQEKRSEKTQVTQERVINELAKIAFASPKALKKWAARTSDKVNALKLLSDHLGLLKMPTPPKGAIPVFLKTSVPDLTGDGNCWPAARGESRMESRARDLRSLARHEEESMPGHRR